MSNNDNDKLSVDNIEKKLKTRKKIKKTLFIVIPVLGVVIYLASTGMLQDHLINFLTWIPTD